MEQLPQDIDQLLADLESANPVVRRAAANELGKMTESQERVVLALEKAALMGDSPFDGSTQAAAAARAALQTPVHRALLEQLGHQLPVPEETLTPTTNLKRLLIFGMAGFVGMLMAYFIFPSSIYFEQWLEFPSPPAGAVQLLTFKQDVGYQLISRTANGETYVYQFYEGWLRRDDSQSDSSEHTFEPCTYAPPEFGPFNNAPQEIISCATATSLAGDGSFRFIYALDQHGKVWRWEMGGGFREAVNDFIIRPCLGGLIGLFVGYVFIKWSRRRKAERKARSNTASLS